MTQPPMEPPPPPPSSPDYGTAPYQPPPSGRSAASSIVRRVVGIGISIGLVFAVGAGVRAFQNSRDDAARNEDGSIASEQDVSVFAVKQGDCLDDGVLAAIGTEVSSEVEDVHAIPCQEPHTLEAYHVFNLEGDDYPGPTVVDDLSQKGCVEAFEPFVGIPPARSKLDFLYLYPQPLAWSEIDDRLVVCLVGEPGGATSTGTLKGVKR
jgi:hypothetical protein